jgi:hypothetical protein
MRAAKRSRTCCLETTTPGVYARAKEGIGATRRLVLGRTSDERWAWCHAHRFGGHASDTWHAHHERVVRDVATVIYESHAFDRLPILADALEDAGCADAELLGHLRSPGPHVRGCWAVDLVLGKS